jgi:hypothetical protein
MNLFAPTASHIQPGGRPSILVLPAQRQPVILIRQCPVCRIKTTTTIHRTGSNNNNNCCCDNTTTTTTTRTVTKCVPSTVVTTAVQKTACCCQITTNQTTSVAPQVSSCQCVVVPTPRSALARSCGCAKVIGAASAALPNPVVLPGSCGGGCSAATAEVVERGGLVWRNT